MNQVRCIAKCPELDGDGLKHCVETEDGIMHRCYREYGCCKVGNVPKWEDVIPKKKIYYAHSMWKYNTGMEQFEIDVIKRMFLGYEIINPRTAVDQTITNEDQAMQECFRVVDQCCKLVCSTISGVIGRGVTEEIEYADEHGIEVWVIEGDKCYPLTRDSVIRQLKHSSNRAYAMLYREGIE